MSEPATTLELNEFLCFAIYSAGHAFHRAYKPLLEQLGLTYPQYLAIVALGSRDDHTVGSLGAELFLDSSTLTPLIKRLEARGLVSRTRDGTDQRQVRVCLTEQGRRLRANARDIPSCILAAAGLPAESMQRLQAEIAGLRENLLKAPR